MDPKVLSVLCNLERKIDALKADVEAMRRSSDRTALDAESTRIQLDGIMTAGIRYLNAEAKLNQKRSAPMSEAVLRQDTKKPPNQPEDHQSIQTTQAANHHKITGPQPFPLDFDLTADPSLASRYPYGARVVLLGGWERYNLKDQAVGTILELHTDNEGRICYAVVKYDDHPVPLTHRGWNLDRFVVRLVDDEGHPVTLKHHEIEPR